MQSILIRLITTSNEEFHSFKYWTRRPVIVTELFNFFRLKFLLQVWSIHYKQHLMYKNVMNIIDADVFLW